MSRASVSEVIIALDAGSSRTRVTLLSPTGQVEADTVAAMPSGNGRAGQAVVSADLLWTQVVGMLRELDLRRYDVLGIGVAAQLGVVLVDEEGNAVDDILLWPDARAAAEVETLRRRLGEPTAMIGRQVSAEMPACKVMWWASQRPAVARSARWVLSVKDYLVMRLTGVAATDETHASYSGWFDVRERAYSEELIRASGVDPGLLPPVRGASERAGVLCGHAADACGLTAGVPVAVGAPDGAAGAFGAGAYRPGDTVDVAGTTDVLLSVVNEPVWFPSGGAVLNAYVQPGRWVVGGPTGLTGGAVEWLSRLMGFRSATEAFDRLGADAMALPVGCEGLCFTPALSGSRMPAWDTGERGTLSGISLQHTPAHILRAGLEGAAFTVLEGIDAVRALGAVIEEITIVGGAAKRPEIAQLRRDLWGVPVRVRIGAEATTVGVSMLAGMAAGVFTDAAEAAKALVPPAVQAGGGSPDEAAVRHAAARWRATSSFARTLDPGGTKV